MNSIELEKCKSIDELMRLWKEKHFLEGRDRFIFDGIVNQERWEKSELKICFLLEESYFDSDSYDEDIKNGLNLHRHHWNGYIQKEKDRYSYNLAKHLKEHAPWVMWCRVETWLRGILRMFGKHIEDPIQEIAVLNIKKSNGNSSSDPNEILQFAGRDKELIRKELELINPDIIICGRTYDACIKQGIFDNIQEIGKLKRFGNRCIVRSGKRIIFECYHPSARISYDKAEQYFKEALVNAGLMD